MNATMLRASAVAIALVAAGVLIFLEEVRPGVGIGSIILGIALFAAGGVNERYRYLWVPFVAIGLLLAALNFTPLRLPPNRAGSRSVRSVSPCCSSLRGVSG